jgi:hypothetical protein
MNPFPNMPGVTDLGDGRSLVKSHDRGHCYTMVEPDGKVSMLISINGPPPPNPNPDQSFHVRDTSSGQEIVDAEGVVVACTTDPAIAKHIKSLLVVYENMKASKASSGG